MYLFPTCHLSLPMLKDPSDILAYCIRHYYSTPSNIYESFLDFEETFAKRLVEYNTQPDTLRDVVEHDFTRYLDRIFNGKYDNTKAIINVEISIETPDKSELSSISNNKEAFDTLYENFYSLKTNLQVIIDNKTYSVSPIVLVQNNKVQFKYS